MERKNRVLTIEPSILNPSLSGLFMREYKQKDNVKIVCENIGNA